jgi:hypothetical protein
MVIGERAMYRKQHLLTAGVSSATTAITIQMIPLRIIGKSRARQFARRSVIAVPYLIPQEAPQSHRTTTMMAHAVQTNEHDRK